MQRFAIREGDGSGGTVDGGGGAAQVQVDAVVGVEGIRAERERLGVGLSLQPGLGERGAVVGQDGLGADQGDTAGPAELAEKGHGRPAGMAGAENDDPRAGQSLIPRRRGQARFW